ncbi:MAG: PH domain-containing protein [Ruminococcus flavefaciens]|nr:PH domain-containing protein [Ruminococcus flavefaciens]MCM1229215.1 PH domain-containing protein [Ruminococcus flavefaciens]
MAKNEIDYIWTDKKRTVFGLPLSFTRYYLTETKFITRNGFFNISEDEIDLYKITDKSITRSFWQRMFGCGTITIHSKDVETPVKTVKSIKNVRQVLDLIDKYMNQMRDKYSIRGRDMFDINYGDDTE